MALSASSQSLNGVKSHSNGPLRVEYVNFSIVSGDTAGTITAASLHTVLYAIVTGITQTAQPVCSGRTAVLAFADPVATVVGQVILIGN